MRVVLNCETKARPSELAFSRKTKHVLYRDLAFYELLFTLERWFSRTSFLMLLLLTQFLMYFHCFIITVTFLLLWIIVEISMFSDCLWWLDQLIENHYPRECFACLHKVTLVKIYFALILIIYMFIHLCGLCAYECLWRPEASSLGVRVTGSCEPPGMGVVNETSVLCKRSVSS